MEPGFEPSPSDNGACVPDYCIVLPSANPTVISFQNFLDCPAQRFVLPWSPKHSVLVCLIHLGVTHKLLGDTASTPRLGLLKRKATSCSGVFLHLAACQRHCPPSVRCLLHPVTFVSCLTNTWHFLQVTVHKLVSNETLGIVRGKGR